MRLDRPKWYHSRKSIHARLDRRSFLKALGLGSLSLALGGRWQGTATAGTAKRPNVLFIAVDDLRPQLGCYGHEQMISPNIDRLASDGVVFTRCYCQVPVCGASRASLLTGMRPTRDRFRTFDTWAEKDAPGADSLPKHFRDNDYYTLANGKIFHHPTDCRDSWSEPHWEPEGYWRDYQEPETRERVEKNRGKDVLRVIAEGDGRNGSVMEARRLLGVDG